MSQIQSYARYGEGKTFCKCSGVDIHNSFSLRNIFRFHIVDIFLLVFFRHRCRRRLLLCQHVHCRQAESIFAFISKHLLWLVCIGFRFHTLAGERQPWWKCWSNYIDNIKMLLCVLNWLTKKNYVYTEQILRIFVPTKMPDKKHTQKNRSNGIENTAYVRGVLCR